jgi:hypothetical protein
MKKEKPAMTEHEIYTKFETAQRVHCIVDHFSYSGSGFAVAEGGQGVFLSNRIVQALNLRLEGEEIICYVVPNYEDKRQGCFFRAVRAERIEVQTPSPAPIEETKDTEESSDLSYFELEKRIVLALEEQGPLTTADLSEIVGSDTLTTSNICRALHRTGSICRADVYRQLGQGRASLVVWSMHPSYFSLEEE